MLYPRETKTRRVHSLDGMWGFKLDEKEEGMNEGWIEAVPHCDSIPVPASFQDFYTDKETREYAGDFWYEKDIFIPEEYRGQEIFLRFGAATHRAKVFVNGVLVREHEGGFLPFTCRLTEIVRYQEENKVVVWMNNELTETNLPCGTTKTLKNGKKMNKPYFDFYNYSGLNRSVSLVTVPKESVTDYDVTFALDGTDADIHYRVETTGSHPVKISLLDETGKTVTETTGKDGILHVADAHLWQVRDAYLYKIVIRILDGTTLVDEYHDNIGIRTVAIEGEDILLNGSPIYLKGFGKHEDSDLIGRGTNLGQIKRDFECMKWIGANAFRTSHYPYSEEIYQMADREGFLIIDEVAAVGMFASQMNFMEASTGKQSGFFSKPGTEQLLKRHLEDVEDMIRRDKNHPCVIAWSLLNEPETTSESAVPYFKKVFDKALEQDPQKRPRTFALIMNSKPDTCHCYQFSDFICLNRYYGWYIQGGYEMSDAMELFVEEMEQWKEKKLNKPFVFTEYGADTSIITHKLPSVMWSQEYQKEYLQRNHEIFDSYGFVKGELVWNFADFQTTEGIMRADGNKKGIFTRQRQPKEGAFYFKERWEKLPLAYKSNC